MTSNATQGVTWVSTADAAGMRDFWEVYEANYERIAERVEAMAVADPHVGPLMRSVAPEVRASYRDQAHARVRSAMDGAWVEYEAALRAQGAVYAHMGLPPVAWGRLARAHLREATPLLVAAFASQPARLAAALLAGQSYVENTVAVIGETYLQTKEEARRKAERLARESEARLAEIYNGVTDPISLVSVDAAGRTALLDANATALAFARKTRAQALGASLDELYGAVEGGRIAASCAEAMRTGAPVRWRSDRGEGEARRCFESTARPLFDESGACTRVLLSAHEVTQGIRAEENERRLAATISSLHEGVSIADPTGKVIFVNPEAERITKLSSRGKGPDEWGSIHDAILDGAGNPVAVEDLPMSRALRGESVHEVEIYVRNRLVPEGVYLLVNAAPVRDAQGRSMGAVTSFRDVTQRKLVERERARWAEIDAKSRAVEAENLRVEADNARIRENNRRVEEASRLKSEFLANMSHELRTPLNSILGFAELLHDGEVGAVSAKQQEFLGDILTSGRHLLQLINDVLDLSKVEAGRLDFHPEELDFARVANEVVSILRTTIANKRLRVEVRVDDDARAVTLDAARLKQVLYNYLSNALKFTPAGGAVSVRVTRHEAAHVRIEVEDTGPGIAPGDLERLFVEFQQLDAGASKRHGGTGLGLALTKRLVQAQGGSVGVRSEVGRGSVFHAVLPRSGGPGAGAERRDQARGAGEAPRGAVRTVLVVEDDARDRESIVQSLAHAGYAVETASTVAQAAAMCRAKEYDAITLDLLLPDGSGVDLLKTLRSESLSEGAPVVVITVVTEHATAGYAVHDVLPKPIDRATLLASLRRAGVAPEQPGSVLVVDDDPAALKLMAAALEQLGYRATLSSDAVRALELAQRETTLAVIVDLLMPEVDGFEFLDRFRAREEHARVPVFVWTVKDLSRGELSRLRESAQAVLQKGAGASELVSALRVHLPNRDVRVVG